MKMTAGFAKIAICNAFALGFYLFQASAAPLPPGTSILAPPVPGPVGGTLLADSGVVPFAAATFSGTLHSQVLINDPSNPFGPGNITLTYQLTCTTGPDGISELSLINFAGFLLDVGFQAPASGQPPTTVTRQPNGNVVDFGFVPPPLGLGTLLPGQTSALLVIQANTPVFAAGIASVIDGSTASPISTFEPAIVPEPGAFGLALAGLGFCGLTILRRKS